MTYLVIDGFTHIHLARQDFKPSNEFLSFLIYQGFSPIVKKVKHNDN